MENEKITDTRYPYTYAADYLRTKIGDDYGKGLISRASAAQARVIIASVTGVDEREIACQLADAYCRENGIKPEPKPDIVQLCRVVYSDEGGFMVFSGASVKSNLKLIFDGETREPKSSEVIK